MILAYGSISILLLLLCIFIFSIVGYVRLQSIQETDIVQSKRDKFRQSKGIVLAILIFSALGLIVHGLLLYTSSQPSENGFSKYEGTEKCESPKCEETLLIK